MGYRHPLVFAVITVIAALLGACSPGPDYVRPDVDTPSAFKEAARWMPAGQPPGEVAEAWWRFIDDPVLDGLESRIVLDNQNVKVVEARYRAARATLDSARSAYYPSATLGASETRARTTTGSSGTSSAGSTATTDTLSASASWEIDVWGRLRRGVESADAKLAASADDLAAARLSAQALLAQSYIQIRAAENQHALLQRTSAAYERFLGLTRNRLAAGVASPLDVALAQTQLASTQAQAIEAENLRAQLEHAIAVLIGQAPASFSLAATGQLPALPEIPALLPSRLLESRPDIAAAERRMAAANAQIGVAEAAYFPVLELTGTAGYRNAGLADLISLPNRFWSLGPALAMTLFDGGARSAATRQAGAAYDEAVATYRQTVLTAFAEVEDNLSAAHLLTQQADVQATALAAARRSREIAENQYKAGISSALAVIVAQSSELSAQVSLTSINSRALQAAVQLLKNAGGRAAAASE